jgi:hypothetical protein
VIIILYISFKRRKKKVSENEKNLMRTIEESNMENKGVEKEEEKNKNEEITQEIPLEDDVKVDEKSISPEITTNLKEFEDLLTPSLIPQSGYVFVVYVCDLLHI